MVPEKRHLDLIAAFSSTKLAGWKLALVGASDYPDGYTRQVCEVAGRTPGVVMTGFQTDLALRELYAHAGSFALPSSHEGLPIAMLEALSYGLPVVASDIPANLEVGLGPSHYFPMGDVESLAERLRMFSGQRRNPHACKRTHDWLEKKYSWHCVAGQTLAVYHSACLM
jgi:glycosyltransferase involved in cell wall biosynthesis